VRYISLVAYGSEAGNMVVPPTGTRCCEMLVLIAATEMPRGEALALRWTDIDLDAGLIERARHLRAHRRQAGDV
jgi:integrase